MPNTGKPSGGCDACRRMKVRCDQQRPGCARCERAGRVCPGYRQGPSIFRDMTATSKERAHNPQLRRRGRDSSPASSSLSPHLDIQPTGAANVKRRSRQSSSSDRLSSRCSSREQSAVPRASDTSASTSIGPVINTKWEDAAICYYFQQYIIYPSENEGLPGYFDILPDLVRESSNVSHLIEALKSVSLSAMGNRSCMDQLRSEAKRCHARAFRQVRTGLNDPRMVREDTTLATLLLLGQYEFISGEKPGQELWMSHGASLSAVIKLRGPPQFQTERGRGLFRVAQSVQQIRDFFQQSATSSASASSMKEIPEIAFRHAMAQCFHDFTKRMSKARVAISAPSKETAPEPSNGMSGSDLSAQQQSQWHGDEVGAEEAYGNCTGQPRQWKVTQRSSPGWHAQLLRTVLKHASLTEEMDAMNEWGLGQRKYWVAPGLAPPADPEPNCPRSLPEYAYVLPGLLHGGGWAWFWASRLKFTEDLMEACATLRAAGYAAALPPQLAERALEQTLRRGVEDVSATIPFLLGEVAPDGQLRVGGAGKCIGAYCALWPLYVLGRVRLIDAERRAWVRARLGTIGSVFGLRQAFVLRDGREQNPPSPAHVSRRLPADSRASAPPMAQAPQAPQASQQATPLAPGLQQPAGFMTESDLVDDGPPASMHLPTDAATGGALPAQDLNISVLDAMFPADVLQDGFEALDWDSEPPLPEWQTFN